MSQTFISAHQPFVPMCPYRFSMLSRTLTVALTVCFLRSCLAQSYLEATKTVPGETLLNRDTNTRCSPGTYSGNGKTPCTECPPGKYSKGTYILTSIPYFCSISYRLLESGVTSCIPARAGYYIPTAKATAETACMSGTYSSTTGCTSCDSCPAGYQCPSMNLASPQKCSPGRYSTGGAKECDRCPAGTFNNIQGATQCCECAAGWFNVNNILLHVLLVLIRYRTSLGPTWKHKLSGVSEFSICIFRVKVEMLVDVPTNIHILLQALETAVVAQRLQENGQSPRLVHREAMGAAVRFQVVSAVRISYADHTFKLIRPPSPPQVLMLNDVLVTPHFAVGWAKKLVLFLDTTGVQDSMATIP